MKTSAQPSHWYILGAGAIGCLWGAHLGLAGHRVTLLLKNHSTLDTFRQRSVIELTDAMQVRTVKVDAELSQTPAPLHNLLVCTKSVDVIKAIASVEPRITATTRIVLLINGLGVQQEVAARYPHIELVCGTTTEGAFRTGPFQVTHAGIGTTYFGLLDDPDKITGPQIKNALLHSLSRLALQVDWDPRIIRRLWSKLAVNCVINPLTAIRGCRNGAILEPDSAPYIKQLCAEIEQVLTALQLEQPDRPLYDQIKAVALATRDNYSSMYQDVHAGRATEIESITGYLCRQAERLGIAVPLNRSLYDTLKGTAGHRVVET